ncbi:nuclear transport factor 2 family protein [Streptomyces gibsoniae]|uniref:Nuclear transport factor 2 family protein n=1 Tax=Streptomyces gibsoniae TaxID=3075529 RepID=A0ABU2U4Q0_9ACTN|nr:nuclear transport factor 2 family protein [Streptomyces sp. DSM 41699]MDT0468202.1 nuclear transport factor 2 family protein [Streptomyces sp. DSM 41699]
MTQRVELATVMDRLAVDGLVTEYAAAVDDGDWEAYRELFTPDGRADYRSAGGIEGGAGQVADWLERTMRLFPVRQHLIVNRHLRFDSLAHDLGDTARVRADYVNPMRLAATEPLAGTATDDGPSAPDFVCGGRYAFSFLRTEDGWRLHQVVVQEKWRSLPGQPRQDPVT